MKWGRVSAGSELGGIRENDGETCEPEGEKEGGQDRFGGGRGRGGVSGPVGVSSRVQSLWLGKEEEEGGEAGERAGSAAVWNTCRLDV